MNDFIIVSFYTENDGYEIEVERLKRSLDNWALPHNIVGIKSKGSWIGNVNYKASFCLDMYKKHKKPIVWLDADARVNQYPYLFHHLGELCDFAAHFRHGSELLSGTLFFNRSCRAEDLLRKWVELCSNNPSVFDQRSLAEALGIQSQFIQYRNLPAHYCDVDTMEHRGASVIEHFQASRRFKKERV